MSSCNRTCLASYSCLAYLEVKVPLNNRVIDARHYRQPVTASISELATRPIAPANSMQITRSEELQIPCHHASHQDSADEKAVRPDSVLPICMRRANSGLCSSCISAGLHRKHPRCSAARAMSYIDAVVERDLDVIVCEVASISRFRHSGRRSS